MKTLKKLSAPALSLFFAFMPLPVRGEELLNDISQLNPTRVHDVNPVRQIADLQKALQYAKENHLKVSISAQQHSQGGHTVFENAVVLDMRKFNQILSVDPAGKTIRVQSGATWKEIQDYLNPLGLSVRVMQASNIFSVGGSLSSNVHGVDPNDGPIVETVKGFRLLSADGSILNVSREENPELFGVVIGGFGLFGVILDVDLELTDNVVYESVSETLDVGDYPAFFEKNIRGNRAAGLHSAKLSIAPESLLREIVATTCRETTQRPKGVFDLQQEKNIFRNKFLFGLSRRFSWGKSLRWALQKKLEAKVGKKEILSRNNAMRPIVKFLEYHSAKDTDILQEYFVPQKELVSFIDGLREIIKNRGINLTSATVRFVPKNTEAFLSYARQDSFAVVLYINQPLSKEGLDQSRRWTQELVDLALKHAGTYYLTYQLYPTGEQIRKAYPGLDSFFEKKRAYDPEELFMNKFYEKYTQS